MHSFQIDDFLPTFIAHTSAGTEYHFDKIAGSRALLCFVGNPRQEAGAKICEAIIDVSSILKQANVMGITVLSSTLARDCEMTDRVAAENIVFLDRDYEIFRKYRMAKPKAPEDTGSTVLRTGAFLIRENIRFHEFISFTPLETFGERVRRACALLPIREPLQPAVLQAPVLQIPHVFGQDLCRRLIDAFDHDGGHESGFMRDIDGKTRGLVDPNFKRRRDYYINDMELRAQVEKAVWNRLLPEIERCFAFRATRIERHLVARYGAEDQGFFRAHRDNKSKAIMHRRFAVTINLNAGDFEGGELWFPEYARRLYKPDTGAAVVFSCSMLHEARPVKSGVRYAFLPFLYDEAAAAVRQANKDFLEEKPFHQIAPAQADVQAVPENSGKSPEAAVPPSPQSLFAQSAPALLPPGRPS